jgi:hypothetical protein
MAQAVRHEPISPVVTARTASDRRTVALMGQAASFSGALARRILLAGLPETDTRRLQVFLLVDSDRLRQEWRIVTEGPVDVYLYAADDPPTVPGWLERAPHQVRIVDAAAHVEAGDRFVLRRPLQYDDFVEILAAIEQQMPAPPPVARTRAPAAAAPPAVRFRLRRWPGAGLLDAIPQGLRMASFITVRYLSVDELASLSGVALERCRGFLDLMRDNDLLRAEPAAPPPLRAMRDPARPDRALLTRLRARLGIPKESR